MKEGYWSKRVDVQRTKVQSSELSINLISQEYGNTNSMINVYIQLSLPWFIQMIFLIQQCLSDSAFFHRPIEDDSWSVSQPLSHGFASFHVALSFTLSKNEGTAMFLCKRQRDMQIIIVTLTASLNQSVSRTITFSC